jgi:hypothetical protein
MDVHIVSLKLTEHFAGLVGPDASGDSENDSRHVLSLLRF